MELVSAKVYYLLVGQNGQMPLSHKKSSILPSFPN